MHKLYKKKKEEKARRGNDYEDTVIKLHEENRDLTLFITLTILQFVACLASSLYYTPFTLEETFLYLQ